MIREAGILSYLNNSSFFDAIGDLTVLLLKPSELKKRVNKRNLTEKQKALLEVLEKFKEIIVKIEGAAKNADLPLPKDFISYLFSKAITQELLNKSSSIFNNRGYDDDEEDSEDDEDGEDTRKKKKLQTKGKYYVKVVLKKDIKNIPRKTKFLPVETFLTLMKDEDARGLVKVDRVVSYEDINRREKSEEFYKVPSGSVVDTVSGKIDIDSVNLIILDKKKNKVNDRALVNTLNREDVPLYDKNGKLWVGKKKTVQRKTAIPQNLKQQLILRVARRYSDEDEDIEVSKSDMKNIVKLVLSVLKNKKSLQKALKTFSKDK